MSLAKLEELSQSLCLGWVIGKKHNNNFSPIGLIWSNILLFTYSISLLFWTSPCCRIVSKISAIESPNGTDILAIPLQTLSGEWFRNETALVPYFLLLSQSSPFWVSSLLSLYSVLTSMTWDQRCLQGAHNGIGGVRIREQRIHPISLPLAATSLAPLHWVGTFLSSPWRQALFYFNWKPTTGSASIVEDVSKEDFP